MHNNLFILVASNLLFTQYKYMQGKYCHWPLSPKPTLLSQLIMMKSSHINVNSNYACICVVYDPNSTLNIRSLKSGKEKRVGDIFRFLSVEFFNGEENI